MKVISVLLSVLFFGLPIWTRPVPEPDNVFVLTKSPIPARSTGINQIAANLRDVIIICSLDVGEDTSNVHVETQYPTEKLVCCLEKPTAKAADRKFHTDLARRDVHQDSVHRLFPRPFEAPYEPPPVEPEPVYEPHTGYPEDNKPDDNSGKSGGSGGSGLSTAQLVAIIVGAAVGAIIVGLLIWYCIYVNMGEGVGSSYKVVESEV